MDNIIKYSSYVGGLMNLDNTDIVRSLIKKGNPFNDMTLKGFSIVNGLSLYDAIHGNCSLTHLNKVSELRGNIALDLLSFLKQIKIGSYSPIKRILLITSIESVNNYVINMLSNFKEVAVIPVILESTDIGILQKDRIAERMKMCDYYGFWLNSEFKEALPDISDLAGECEFIDLGCMHEFEPYN